MARVTRQHVDPDVSSAKLQRELAEYLSLEADYRKRGWFLIEAKGPLVTVLLAANKTTPPTLVTAVRFDYTNYDADPPSVRFVDPFSGRPFSNKELPIRLLRAVPGPEVDMPGPGGIKAQLNTTQDLMQAHTPDELPFLCIAGVKEYHDHPGHSGDSWELHRPAGEGRLVRLLEVISKYSIDTVKGFHVNLAPQVTLATVEPPL